MSVPTILQASDTRTLLRLWLHQYHIGRNTGIPLSILGTSAFAYLATFTPAGELARTYAAAGTLMLSIMIFTLTFVLPISVKLENALEKVEMGGKGADEVRNEEIRGLVKLWQRRNHLRLLLPVTALALGTWTTLF